MNARRNAVPVSFFGMAVGALALANAWRVGVRLWHLPQAAADALSYAGLAVWAAITLAYVHFNTLLQLIRGQLLPRVAAAPAPVV